MLMIEMKKVWRGVSETPPPPISEPTPNSSGYVSERSKECFPLTRNYISGMIGGISPLPYHKQHQ